MFVKCTVNVQSGLYIYSIFMVLFLIFQQKNDYYIGMLFKSIFKYVEINIFNNFNFAASVV